MIPLLLLDDRRRRAWEKWREVRRRGKEGDGGAGVRACWH